MHEDLSFWYDDWEPEFVSWAILGYEYSYDLPAHEYEEDQYRSAMIGAIREDGGAWLPQRHAGEARR